MTKRMDVHHHHRRWMATQTLLIYYVYIHIDGRASAVSKSGGAALLVARATKWFVIS